MLKIENHILSGDGIKHLNCKKCVKPLLAIDTVVIHYTGGHHAIDSAYYLADNKTNVSAHIVIGRDGKIYQLVPFNIQAWHCGKSSWSDRVGINRYSIGIELANAGKLEKVDDIYQSYFMSEYPEEEVYTCCVGGVYSYWHKYTDAQIKALIALTNCICKVYPISYILGHEDITNRKIDPGAAFPWERMPFHGLNLNL